ncbi:MAG: RadC family protein [Clostridia bacterium]|nr:RadC family protein [Clostridia bacterium]
MSKSITNSHTEHRKRVRERYLNSCAKGFSEHELLEMLLFYSIPRANTNEMAHALIERFGSINGVMEASIDELKLVRGIGDKSAILINLTMMLAKEYAETRFKESRRIVTIEDLVDYANIHTFGALNELVCGVFMDDNLNVISTNVIASGTINETRPMLRTVMELCVLKRATALAIFHNHPNGGVEPSTEDIDFTILLERELKIIGVTLTEHVIVDGKDYTAILKLIKEKY